MEKTEKVSARSMIEITELLVLIAINSYTSTVDFAEVAEQLYAQMMGWC